MTRNRSEPGRATASDRRPSLPGWLGGALVVGGFAALLYAEHRRPLRRSVESKLGRDIRNMAVAGLSAATLRVLEKPVIAPLARQVERRGWGLISRLGLPAGVRDVLAIALMDYTLYHWHVLTHKVPLLWRFHLVHHVDLDLSATTALRFHFGEMALSVLYRAAQVLLIGTSPRALAIWQNMLVASVVFHHSNLRLPKPLERSLVGLIVTPRMHGIHHSVVDEERDSNWSSGLTVWDRLHGTLKLDVPQDEITIGVPGYERRLGFSELVALPFLRPGSRRALGRDRGSADASPTGDRALQSADAVLLSGRHPGNRRDQET